MKKKKKKTDNEFVVYCIHKDLKYTYVGVTNNFRRRIRQHNGEIKGGAKYTSRYKNWQVLFKIHGLTSRQHILQLEWALKHRRRRGYSGVKGRIRTLEYLLSLPTSWTKKAPSISTLNLDIRVFGISKKKYLLLAGQKQLKYRAGRNITYKFPIHKKKQNQN